MDSPLPSLSSTESTDRSSSAALSPTQRLLELFSYARLVRSTLSLHESLAPGAAAALRSWARALGYTVTIESGSDHTSHWLTVSLDGRDIFVSCHRIVVYLDGAS
jgi:hypothetical protein